MVLAHLALGLAEAVRDRSIDREELAGMARVIPRYVARLVHEGRDWGIVITTADRRLRELHRLWTGKDSS